MLLIAFSAPLIVSTLAHGEQLATLMCYFELPASSPIFHDMQIVSALTRGERLPIPDRASLPGPDTLRFAGLAGYIVLMQRCWAQEPSERPGFEEIVQCLRRLLEEAPA